MLLMCFLVVALVFSADPAWAQYVKIVGIGSSTCAVFNAEIAATPMIECDYLAWAQGYMSRALVRAPSGVDEGLNLTPVSFPLSKQADFLREFCGANETRDYSDGVRELYRRLRGSGT